jgi:murein DD-endopeptidase MepM/ murein hydrolase activator NlpD
MQLILAHEGGGRTRTWRVVPWQVALMGAAALLLLVLVSGSVYHWLFLTAAREGWPVVSTVVRLVVRDEIAQRDRVMRDNLDALATKLGESQARIVALEAVGERVASLAGLKPEELGPWRRDAAPAAAPSASVPAAAPSSSRPRGQGGLFVPWPRSGGPSPSLSSLQGQVAQLELRGELLGDVLLLSESRLFESRLAKLMVPSTVPVDGEVGSPFGFRIDPITGRNALHTGLDFPAEVGTPIRAAAGGMVSSADWHPAYGNTLIIDHPNGLQTLYAHNHQVLVKRGDLVKRGQVVATVGNTGRSTGSHLHFEVLVNGVPQDPARFLSGGSAGPATVRPVDAAAVRSARQPGG